MDLIVDCQSVCVYISRLKTQAIILELSSFFLKIVLLTKKNPVDVRKHIVTFKAACYN